MSADLLRLGAVAARAWAADPDSERESDAAVHLLVADWLDYQADCAHLWRHLSESDDAEKVARAYLGET